MAITGQLITAEVSFGGGPIPVSLPEPTLPPAPDPDPVP